ncbi:MAG: response regulator transcription factor [Nevskia sp.]|nr:response regulator transcription factor [Nevskia sp.]
MRILLVEDHPDLAANLGDYLSARGHQVDFAADGPAGLRLAQTKAFDAVILDRLLPRMEGAEVCRRMRAAQLTTPVLMLTALDAVSDKVEGFAAGADDYLVKPFAMAELLARLDALNRRAGAARAARRLQVADLTMDLDTLEVRRGRDRLALTPAGRRLLEVLMRGTHRVVARDELEAALWGEAGHPTDVLRAHMYALRNVVDRPYRRKLLHTVHGTGYRLASLDD